jgi:4,5-dihydroxyphthalate decarboxylase
MKALESSHVIFCCGFLENQSADNPVTMGMKDGRVTSSLVTLDYCGPTLAHDGFKPMFRENAFDAGELAIVTYLQAKANGKPFVMLPAPEWSTCCRRAR